MYNKRTVYCKAALTLQDVFQSAVGLSGKKLEHIPLYTVQFVKRNRFVLCTEGTGGSTAPLIEYSQRGQNCLAASCCLVKFLKPGLWFPVRNRLIFNHCTANLT